MLEAIFGNATAEKVLLHLVVHDESYARELARTFHLPVSVIQKQLIRLERGGILASRLVGKTRVFQLDPSYPFVRELEALLRRALDFLPETEREPYQPKRKRPRTVGKP